MAKRNHDISYVSLEFLVLDLKMSLVNVKYHDHDPNFIVLSYSFLPLPGVLSLALLCDITLLTFPHNIHEILRGPLRKTF